MTPPPYPRIPYLFSPPDGQTGERLVPVSLRDSWFGVDLLVEEKLDGANVTLWLQDGVVQVASRGGQDAMDRAGQLGPLRAWASERYEALSGVMQDGSALYGEWLWLRHGAFYDALPDWLVLLDTWHPDRGFLGTAERDRIALTAGLLVPPVRFQGVLGGPEDLVRLFGTSTFSSSQAEGLILRRSDGERCKVVDPSWQRADDAAFGRRDRNRLAVSARAAG